ncbi:FAD-dependent oxidoreductase [Bacillus sp. 165]|uniref:NAD(P)/FAD-dependent oxidoreductase n=1 Tax=Bacillus sp. 165 TaxID=1529117 RepID=UPI001ADA4518|nr:FAD-dependent oxidoreductase [Bacillus sp. 165]MBO9128457.1 FAD-dependent oxidoreductase [Bacillus sp. 165]
MNLKSGKLFWPQTIEAPSFPMLEEDIMCDVLIIGGGETGAHIAYMLSQTGMDVVVVDKRKAAHGSTSANTGLLQFSNDKTLTSFIHSFGEEKGVRFYQLCYEALNTLDEIVPSLNIDPYFIRRGSLYFASEENDVNMLKKEYEILKKHGFPVEFFTQTDIEKRYPFSKPAALYTKGDAEVNPVRLSLALLDKALERGIRIYAHTEIVGHAYNREEIHFFTNNKRRITAKKAIIATGYEAQTHKADKNAVLTSSYAIVTNPIPHFEGWFEQSLIWETARPYLYCRTYVDGRIIMGGLDEFTILDEYRDKHILHKRDLLLAELKKMFPKYNLQAEYYWGATFGSTHDGMPLLTEYPDMPNCYFALGYGGNGTVYSMIFAEIFKELFTKGISKNLAILNRKS